MASTTVVLILHVPAIVILHQFFLTDADSTFMLNYIDVFTVSHKSFYLCWPSYQRLYVMLPMGVDATEYYFNIVHLALSLALTPSLCCDY